jgi:hypothetical protein
MSHHTDAHAQSHEDRYFFTTLLYVATAVFALVTYTVTDLGLVISLLAGFGASAALTAFVWKRFSNK